MEFFLLLALLMKFQLCSICANTATNFTSDSWDKSFREIRFRRQNLNRAIFARFWNMLLLSWFPNIKKRSILYAIQLSSIHLRRITSELSLCILKVIWNIHLYKECFQRWSPTKCLREKTTWLKSLVNSLLNGINTISIKPRSLLLIRTLWIIF